jgi:hypothetical protein
MRHHHRPLVLAALAVASLGACGGSPGSTPSPAGAPTGGTGTTVDPCASSAPGSVAPPPTTGAPEACQESPGTAQGGGADDPGQDPTSGTRLGDTGSGGSSSGPAGGSNDGPVSSVESDRPPAGY